MNTITLSIYVLPSELRHFTSFKSIIIIITAKPLQVNKGHYSIPLYFNIVTIAEMYQ